MTAQQEIASLKLELTLAQSRNADLEAELARFKKLAVSKVTKDDFASYQEFIDWLVDG